METKELLKRAKNASYALLGISTEEKRDALLKMADALLVNQEKILEANRKDLEAAEGKIAPIMMDRLRLDESRIHGMADGIKEVALLPDPVGKLLSETVRPNGLRIRKIQVPMGVIAIIYESRPNVTSDAAALALMAGSACVLRSGKEAHGSAAAITAAMKEGLRASALPEDALFLVEDVSRESATELMKARGYVDLLIPRGGKGLIRACVDNATVPVLETGTGICHVYADESADIETAIKVIDNAKTSRPSVCNAMEVLLLHKNVAPRLFPALYRRLTADRIEKGLPPVRFLADEKDLETLTAAIKKETAPSGTDNALSFLSLAPEDAFDTEHLDYVMTVGIVEDVKEAVRHINAHSTGHSESILTKDPEAAEYFTGRIDSACVYVNASTRFTDGGEFGFGAEMGISTQKLHARGPLGLNELCSYKYVITGNGQIR